MNKVEELMVVVGSGGGSGRVVELVHQVVQVDKPGFVEVSEVAHLIDFWV